jgi:hypothetical protein
VSLKIDFVAGRQGGGRETNECYSETKKNWNWGITWRPEKCHLAPEVKTSNEMTCDYVWDQLYPDISLICSKWYIRKVPFVLGAQPLDMSPLSHWQFA